MNNPKVKIIDSALSSEDGSAYFNEDQQSSYISNKKTKQLVSTKRLETFMKENKPYIMEMVYDFMKLMV